MRLNIIQFNPYIIGIRYFNGNVYDKGKIFPERSVYDYEIEYIIDGSGSMVFDGHSYTLQRGMTFFRRPHQKNYGVMPYECYLITFDMLGNWENKTDHFTVPKDTYQPLVDIDLNIPPVIRAVFNEKIERMLQNMHEEYLNESVFKQQLLKAYFFQLINELYVHQNIDIYNDINVTPVLKNKIKKCMNHIEQNYKRNIDISELSSIANLSTSYFHKIFKLYTGLSPAQYLIGIRLDRAKKLMTHTELEIKEICYECGMADTSYFCKLFKQKNGYTPLEFKARNMLKF